MVVTESKEAAGTEARRPQLGWRRVVFFNAVILVVFLLIVSVGAEASLRLFARDAIADQREKLRRAHLDAKKLLSQPAEASMQRLFMRHPFYGHTLRPFLRTELLGWRLETDAYGFRNPPDQDLRALPEEQLVIGLFGGSAAFGWGIDGRRDTLAARLESLLNQGSSGARVQVVNLAMPAWHYPQQLFALARVIEHLDGIIAYDGFNEIFLAATNVRAASPIPPDFPWLHFFVPLFQTARRTPSLATYGQLSSELGYDPGSLRAKSWVYIWFRYRLMLRKRAETQRIVQSAGDTGGGLVTERVPGIVGGTIDDLLAFAIKDLLKYGGLVNALAAAERKPVLHITQAIMHADESTPVRAGQFPEYAGGMYAFIKEAGHPSVVYDRVREARRRAYQGAGATPSVHYLDLAEALAPEDENWIDFVHPSAAGVKNLAEIISRHLAESGYLDELKEAAAASRANQ